MRVVAFVMLILTALARSASAQGAPDRCGDLTNAEADLEDLAHYFTAEEDAYFREGLIDRVGPTEPREVLRDSRICTALYRRVVRQLRATHTDWRQLQREGFKHVILRYGPYYAVLIDRIPPPGKIYLGWTEMLIFRVSDLSYVGGGMV